MAAGAVGDGGIIWQWGATGWTPQLPPIGGLIVALLVPLLAPPVSVLEAVERELLAPINGTLHSLILSCKHELSMMMLMLMLKRMLMQ